MDPRRIALAVATVASTCACAWLSFALLPESSSMRPWKGARLLAVDAEREESEVLAALDAAGLRDVVSESRQMLSFSDFDEWESISLSEVDSRLMETDPRRDPYIAGLKRYFQASSGSRAYRLYYLLDSLLPAPSLRGRIGKVLGTMGDWELVETGAKKNWIEGAILWLIMAIVISLCAARKRTAGKRFRSVLPLFAWIGIFLSSSWVFLLACMPAMALFFLCDLALQRHPYEKRYRIDALYGLFRSEIGFLPLIILLIGSLPGFVLLSASYSLAILASIGCTAILEMTESWRKKEAGRRVFTPIALRRTRGYAPSGKGEDWASLLAFAVFSLIFVFLSYAAFPFTEATADSKNLLSFPHPHGYTGHSGATAVLPNYRDYLEHAEYQRHFLEADLSGSGERRPFVGYSRGKDGSLLETAEEAARLEQPSSPNGGGIEDMLRRAGEKAIIVDRTWVVGGTGASYGTWSLPIVLSAMLAGFFARLELERSRRRKRGLVASAWQPDKSEERS